MLCRVYSWPMADEDAVLKETMRHPKEASRQIRTSPLLMQKYELVEDRHYLRLAECPSDLLDVTEAAYRAARRRRDSL